MSEEVLDLLPVVPRCVRLCRCCLRLAEGRALEGAHGQAELQALGASRAAAHQLRQCHGGCTPAGVPAPALAAAAGPAPTPPRLSAELCVMSMEMKDGAIFA